MTVFYILWQSIDGKYTYKTRKQRAFEEELNDLEEEKPEDINSEIDVSSFRRRSSIKFLNPKQLRDANQFTVDCSKSTTGLFLGMVTLLATIISLITYFIYREHNPIESVIISEMTEFCLIFLSLISGIIIKQK